MARIFISYSRADSDEFVDRLANDIARAGHEVFYDKKLNPGDSWAKVLDEALSDSDYVLAVLSPGSVQSIWAQQEWLHGLSDEIQNGRTKVIPLKVQPCEPPPLLAEKKWIDFTSGDYPIHLLELLRALKQPEKVGSLAEKLPKKELKSLAGEIAPRLAAFTGTGSGDGRSAVPLSFAGTGDGSVQKKNCFVVMPFGVEALNIVYEDFVKPVAEEECGFTVERGDDMFGSNPIMQDILASINAADIIIADLTGKNANVFYEVGICHALDKNVLLLAQSIDEVPFDLRHRRVLVYDYTPRGCKRLEKKLKEHLTAMVEKAKAAAPAH